MNPASAASAVETSTGMSGMGVAALVILSLVVVVLALALIKARWPASKTAQFVTGVEQHVESVASEVAQDIRNAEPEVKAAVDKVELAVGDELSQLLLAAEKRLTDTTGEDAAIATAQAYLARVAAEVQSSINAANAQKAAKLAALQAHVATLTAAAATVTNVPGGITGTDAPTAVVNAGPTAS